jgi:hypothetical protein
MRDVFPYQDLLSHSKLSPVMQAMSLLSAVEEIYLYPLVNVPHQLQKKILLHRRKKIYE